MLKNLFTGGGSSYFSLGKADIHGLPSSYLGLPLWQFALSMLLIPFLFLSEWLISHNGKHRFRGMPLYVRWTACYVLIFAILIMGVYNIKQFIYFQF